MSKLDNLIKQYKKIYSKQQDKLITESADDGWDLDDGPLADTELESLLSELEGLSYEIKNCRRGEYINTYAQLGQQLIELGERLSATGNEILSFSAEYDPED